MSAFKGKSTARAQAKWKPGKGQEGMTSEAAALQAELEGLQSKVSI